MVNNANGVKSADTAGGAGSTDRQAGANTENRTNRANAVGSRVEAARLEAAAKNGDVVALRALDRVREAAFARGEVRTRRPDAGRKAREIAAAAEVPLGEEPRSPGAGLADVGSGSRPSSRDPHPLGQLLERVVRDRGWKEKVDVASVTSRWDQIVGPNVAKHLVVESFDDDGVLTLRASSPEWETQGRMMMAALAGKIASEVGEGVVRKIELRGPEVQRRRGYFAIPRRSPTGF